jgi:SAM-dependent methyltransferase
VPLDKPSPELGAPSPWIVRFLALARPGGSLLDLAAGSGRHSSVAAARGFRVTAVDREIAALEKLAGIEVVRADLEAEAWPFPGRRFDVIVVANYLHRPLLPLLATSLEPEGVLIYETFAQDNERFGRPSNPAFLLAPGELLRALVPPLSVVAYEHGIEALPRPAVRQRIAAIRSDTPVPLP